MLFADDELVTRKRFEYNIDPRLFSFFFIYTFRTAIKPTFCRYLQFFFSHDPIVEKKTNLIVHTYIIFTHIFFISFSDFFLTLKVFV